MEHVKCAWYVKMHVWDDACWMFNMIIISKCMYGVMDVRGRGPCMYRAMHWCMSNAGIKLYEITSTIMYKKLTKWRWKCGVHDVMANWDLSMTMIAVSVRAALSLGVSCNLRSRTDHACRPLDACNAWYRYYVIACQARYSKGINACSSSYFRSRAE